MSGAKGSWCARIAFSMSLVMVAGATVIWPLLDILGPMLVPIVLTVFWMGFVACLMWAVGCAVSQRRNGVRSILPVFALVATACLVWFAPLSRLWLHADYHWHRSDRQRIVREVLTGSLAAVRTGVVALPQGEAYVSAGGNEIMVETHDGKQYALFYTFRGFPEGYSGFLFVPEGGSPARFDELRERALTERVEFEPQWYFVKHR